MEKKTLFAVASGSGGHILPALIAAQNWHNAHKRGTVVFCTGTSKLDKKILSSYPFITKTHHFAIDRFFPKKLWCYPKIIMQVIGAFIKSIMLVIKERPTTVISTGGLIALPICLAARVSGSRIEVYELNVTPGKAVKFLMPLAHNIYTPFAATRKHCKFLGFSFKHKCVQCAYPLRFAHENIRNVYPQQLGDLITYPPYAFKERKTIFLLGGSQGSRLLNNALKQFIESLDSTLLSSLQIIHQTGSIDHFDWTAFYKKRGIPAMTFSYYENIAACFQHADLVICRAGAGTLFEVAFFEKPCIVVPLISPSTTHQKENAKEIAEQYPYLFTLLEQSTVAAQPAVLRHAILKKLNLLRHTF